MSANLDRRKILWIEVGVVLALFALPATATAMVDFLWPQYAPSVAKVDTEVSRIVQGLEKVIPVLFIIWASGDALSDFGLRGIVWWRAIQVAVIAYFLDLGTRYLSSHVAMHVAPSFYSHSARILYMNSTRLPATTGFRVARTLAIVIGAFMEELIMRGYLITRLRELLGSAWKVLLVSSALFALYHIYEGAFAPVEIFFTGITYGLAFLVTGSLIPGTVAHALFNITSMLRARF